VNDSFFILFDDPEEKAVQDGTRVGAG